MKKIVFSFLAVFSFVSINAQCNESGLRIWPYSEFLPQNPIFVIMGYSDAEPMLYDLNKKNPVMLISNNDTVELEIVETLYGQYNISQMVLKPKTELVPKKTYKLVIQNLENKQFSPKKWNANSGKFDEPTWTITEGKDMQSNEFSKKPKAIEKKVETKGCEAYRKVIFSYEKENTNPVLVKSTITDKETQKKFVMYVTPGEKTFSVGYGECVGEFYLSQEKKYEAQFELVDEAGNVSDQTNKILFAAPVN